VLVSAVAYAEGGVMNGNKREVFGLKISDRGISIRPLSTAVALAIALAPQASFADEGGVSFWLPGTYGSLAATPQQPGWSLAMFDYQTTVSAGGAVALAREFEIRTIPLNLSATVNANLHATAALGAFLPSYVFATPVFGGQAAVGVMGIYGNSSTSLTGSVAGTVNGMPFGPISLGISDSTTSFGDLYPQFSLRWNSGVNNYMTYITGDIPVGSYSFSNLANIGIGHGAIDAGGGYTYFDPKTGREFTGVLGFTYNMLNPSTQYQNGVDMHFDWGASQFLTKQLQVGLVGYAYKQISCDSGSGDRVGCFESQVLGIGPQVGFIFPLGDKMQGYLNFKGYREFDAVDRASGWNTWVTFVISPAEAAPPATTKHMITK
jgi:hypothetical protein